MTIQVHDQFLYQGRELAITAFTGNGPFVPSAFGLAPVEMSTACHRGYRCTYEVANDMLLIRELQIRLDGPTELLGGWPRFCADRHCFVYERLSQPLPFSGGALIGVGDTGIDLLPPLFLKRLLGFPFPFQLYGELYELTFDAGRLTSAADRSRAVREFDGRIRTEKWRPSEEEVTAWIESAFGCSDYRDYDRSLY